MTTPFRERPYIRLVIPEEDGTFLAEIFEFPGCIAAGETQAEALATLDENAQDWIEAALEQRQTIPDPLGQAEFSGIMVLRMPRSLHKRAVFAAKREGVDLSRYIVTCLAEKVGRAGQ